MPIYEYMCPNCGLKFDLLRPVSRRDQPTTCPQCGGQAERQLARFVARSGLDSDVMNYAANAVSRSSGSSCASCTASSCAGCK